jgi:hypothetical protein
MPILTTLISFNVTNGADRIGGQVKNGAFPTSDLLADAAGNRAG